MVEKKDYYEVLGVPRDVSEEEIKKTYRRLARQHHPDVNPGDKKAEEKFKEISEAYAVLSDPEKRRQYDMYGHSGMRDAGFDFDTVWRDVSSRGFGFGGFDDIFDVFFGRETASRARRSRTQPQRGADLAVEVEVSLEEAYHGAERTITFNRAAPCSACEGSGAKPGTSPQACNACGGKGEVRKSSRTFFGEFVSVTTCGKCGGSGRVIGQPCPKCRGEGKENQEKKLTLKIPKGVDTGTKIRFSGEGEAGAQGGSPGDLYVYIKISNHPVFKREERNIYVDTPISFTQAALGGVVPVKTLDSDETLAIPPGTQHGNVFRIKGKGMPGLHGGPPGDQFVRVSIPVPTHLTPRQKELLQKLAEENGEASHKKPSDGKSRKWHFGK